MRITIFLIILCLVLPYFSFAGEMPVIPAPKTFEEAKKMAEQAEKELPEIMKELYRQEALPIWQKTYYWLKVNVWFRIQAWLKPEFEKRKQFLKERFQKEKKEIKEEIKTEVPKAGKSFWEKIKALIR